MRMVIRLALAGLAFTAAPLSAQGACADIRRFFSEPPTLGEWADVRLDMKKDQGKRPMVMRVGFVGQEDREGKRLYRTQMIMRGRGGQEQVMQTLTPWGADALGQQYDTEMVMKMGNQPAVIMPVKADESQEWDLRKVCERMEFVGEETIEVPAGRYKTRHYKGPDGESWVSPDVPAWHIVRMVTKKGDEIVLTGTGTGFENKITEQPMDMKEMMRNPAAAKKMREGREEESQ